MSVYPFGKDKAPDADFQVELSPSDRASPRMKALIERELEEVYLTVWPAGGDPDVGPEPAHVELVVFGAEGYAAAFDLGGLLRDGFRVRNQTGDQPEIDALLKLREVIDELVSVRTKDLERRGTQ